MLGCQKRRLVQRERERDTVGKDDLGRRRHDEGHRRVGTRDIWGPGGWSGLMVPRCGLGQIAPLSSLGLNFSPGPNSRRQRTRDWCGSQLGEIEARVLE